MTRYSLVAALALSALPSPVSAQPGPPPDRPGRVEGQAATPGADAAVERLLTFDANGDGSLARTELKDERLLALFDRADANQDGVATRAELKAAIAKEIAALAAPARRGGPMGGGPEGAPPRPDDAIPDEFRARPDGRRPMGDGPDGVRPGPEGPPQDRRGPAGGDFRGQRPRPGQVLPRGVQERLNLTDDQRRRVDALQEIVDTQLDKILTPEQKQMLDEFGPPGPPGSFDGPRRGDGAPPRGDGPPRNRQRPNSDDRPARPANEP